MLTLTTRHIRPVEEAQLERLFIWVDDIPFSRKKKSLARDFSDGVMVAELVKFFIPKLVDLHAYTGASSSRVKEHNWFHLNKKVLCKLGLEVTPDFISDIAQCKQWAVETFLIALRDKLDAYLSNKQAVMNRVDIESVRNLERERDKPEAEQRTLRRALVHEGRGQLAHESTPNARIQCVPYQPTPRHEPSGRISVPVEFSPLQKSPRNHVQEELVPKAILLEKLDLLDSHNQRMEILAAKVQKLEHLLHLKDIRIEDLTARLDQVESLSDKEKFKGPRVQKLPEWLDNNEKLPSKPRKRPTDASQRQQFFR